jgi:Vitamin K-dependent gamma-carboxylase
VSNPAGQLAAAWHRFWFDPQDSSTLGLFRIAFGLVATGWTVTQGPDLLAFYGRGGIQPTTIGGAPGSWGVLTVWHGSTAVVVLFAVTLAASLALTVGLFSRLASILVLVGIISFMHRNGLVTNSGDGLVRNLAFFCALAPSGTALSIDRLRRAPGRFWEFPTCAPWALRLVQIQVSIGYLTAVWDKAGDELWRNGTAVSYALRMEDIHRLPTPAFITHSVVLVELLTFGTMVLELSLGILVWNRTLRPWVLLLGITLHLSIDVSIMVGFFSYAMLAAYVSFVSPEASTMFLLGLRDRIGRRGRGRRAAAQHAESVDHDPEVGREDRGQLAELGGRNGGTSQTPGRGDLAQRGPT